MSKVILCALAVVLAGCARSPIQQTNSHWQQVVDEKVAACGAAAKEVAKATDYADFPSLQVGYYRCLYDQGTLL